MKFSKINTLLLGAAFALSISSCEEDAETDSIKTSFPQYSSSLATTPVTATESDEVYTLTFSLDAKQNTDVTIVVEAGESSTATEGVDFEILTHEIEIPAYAGQDGFEVQISVLQDLIDEAGDENVYLTFHTLTPSGLQKSETLVATIVDSDEIPPPPPSLINLSLAWKFGDPLLAGFDACALTNEDGDPLIDVDLTIQTEGSGDYADDIMGYEMATLACPEEGVFAFEDMADNTTYDLDIYFYGTAPLQSSDMKVFITHTSEALDFSGEIEVPATFDSNANSKVVLKISRAGDTITIATSGGTVLATGSLVE